MKIAIRGKGDDLRTFPLFILVREIGSGMGTSSLLPAKSGLQDHPAGQEAVAEVKEPAHLQGGTPGAKGQHFLPEFLQAPEAFNESLSVA